MGMMTPVVPASEAELIDLAAGTYGSILRTGREMLRQKFELGRLVNIHLQRHTYAHAAVTILAKCISGVCGKVIVPQRLYEAARFYETFGGQLERVWELERRLSHPLTYTFLIRSIIPRVYEENAWNPQEWGLYQDAQLTRLEKAVHEIESLKGKVELKGARTVSSGDPLSLKEEPGSIEPSSAVEASSGMLTICQDSEGYQRFRVTTLVAAIVQSCKKLEASHELLSEDDRQSLNGVVPIVGKLVGRSLQGAAA
jgi:hypothetical protein